MPGVKIHWTKLRNDFRSQFSDDPVRRAFYKYTKCSVSPLVLLILVSLAFSMLANTVQESG